VYFIILFTPESSFERLLSAPGSSTRPSHWARSLAGVVPWEPPGLQLSTSAEDRTYRFPLSHTITGREWQEDMGCLWCTALFSVHLRNRQHMQEILFTLVKKRVKKEISQELLTTYVNVCRTYAYIRRVRLSLSCAIPAVSTQDCSWLQLKARSNITQLRQDTAR